MTMKIYFPWEGHSYSVDLSDVIEIAIPLRNGMDEQPNAYGAPYFSAMPVVAGDFIGALDAGAPVNFFNLMINPHGNGTHTECVGHILAGPWTIRACTMESHFVAELISVTPEVQGTNHVITKTQLIPACQYPAQALIIRTLPNPLEKRTRKYSGTHPPYFSEDATAWMAERGIRHLLTDLPSVDPEVDGGALLAHRAFWQADGPIREDASITEMVFVASEIPDGLYLLDLQNLALDLDVSPSRPRLFTMRKEHEN